MAEHNIGRENDDSKSQLDTQLKHLVSCLHTLDLAGQIVDVKLYFLSQIKASEEDLRRLLHYSQRMSVYHIDLATKPNINLENGQWDNDFVNNEYNWLDGKLLNSGREQIQIFRKYRNTVSELSNMAKANRRRFGVDCERCEHILNMVVSGMDEIKAWEQLCLAAFLTSGLQIPEGFPDDVPCLENEVE